MNHAEKYLKKQELLGTKKDPLNLKAFKERTTMSAFDYLSTLGFNKSRAGQIIKAGKLISNNKKVLCLSEEVKTRKVRLKIGKG